MFDSTNTATLPATVEQASSCDRSESEILLDMLTRMPNWLYARKFAAQRETIQPIAKAAAASK